MLLRNHIDIRRHAGKQAAARIVGERDDFIGHDIGAGYRLLAHLADAALKGFVGIGVDRKIRRLAFAHRADIGLIDHDFDFKL